MRRILWLSLLLTGCLPALTDQCDDAHPCAAGRCFAGVCVSQVDGGPVGDGAVPGDGAVDAGPQGDGGLVDCVPQAEVCNDADDDCDGRADEGLWRPCGDEAAGTGLCRAGEERCAAGRWSVCTGAVDPATERCDGEDNDCDGAVDETLAEVCYGGPAGTAGRGRCRGGERACVAGGASPECGDQVLPGVEICNNEDDDCDGRVDEDLTCRCREGDVRACFSGSPAAEGVGLCQSGQQRCDRGRWGTCAGEVGPSDERCNGEDDDCDGTLDEGLAGNVCRVGLGTCGRDGALRCVDQGLICDAGEGAGEPEHCNGRDDDCDGHTDEGFDLGQACAAGLGQCVAEGFRRCQADGGAACEASTPPPRAETCNGQDDDCDGQVDEGEDRRPLEVRCYEADPATVGVGRCRPGTQQCEAGAPVGVCLGAIEPGPEICDGRDDDCDGRVDELPEGGCACAPGVTRSCYEGPPGTEAVGLCTAGVRTCLPEGRFGACASQVGPREEDCNGLDDDCDGRVDEAVPGAGRSCTRGVGVCAREGRVACRGGVAECDAQAGHPEAEACNGLDDDCDGRADEDLAGLGQPCRSGVGACAAEGSTRCEPGRGVVCDAVPAPGRAERCDGSDDDCDGRVDEGVANACGACGPLPVDDCDGRDSDCDGRIDEAPDGRVGRACQAGVGACAAQGIWACGAGGLVCAARVAPGAAELCNGLDDDCDGRVDNDALCALPGVDAARCVEGSCRLQSCLAGYFDDDGLGANGCERGCNPGPGPGGLPDVALGPGRGGRTLRAGGVLASVVLEVDGGLRLVRGGGPPIILPVAPGTLLTWPDLAHTGGTWVVVARVERGETRGVAKITFEDGRLPLMEMLPGVSAGAPVLRADAAGGLVVAYLASEAEGRPRRLFLGRPGEQPRPVDVGAEVVEHPTAGPALIADGDSVRLVVPVAQGDATVLRAVTVRADRLVNDGDAPGVGPVVGPLSVARSGAGAVVAYVGGGALRRHTWRLDAQPALGPASALREGQGVATGGLVRTPLGYLAVSAAPAVADACQLHSVRLDGGLVGTVVFARPGCRALQLSAGDDSPLVTWLDDVGQVWLADPGCR